MGRGDLVPALATVDQLAKAATVQRARYACALAPVLRADVLRRMARWEESLDAVSRMVVRADAVVVHPFRIIISDRVTAAYASPEIRPVQLGAVSLL